MKKCAFLTLCERGDFVIDDEHAIQPMADIGWEVSTVSWRQQEIPWSDFDAVIVRSTWDYWNDVDAFLETLETINRESRLANSLELVNWNLAKTYLRDLAKNGVPIVPTLWPDKFSRSDVENWMEAMASERLVIKPVVGANGDGAFRLGPNTSEETLAEIEERFSNCKAMVQRFIPSIIEEGEYSLFFFAGEFSHATLRVPTGGEFRSQEERGAEVHSVEPEALLLKRGQQVIEALPDKPLYARVDFVREGEDFLVMETELVEPSMYLRTEPGAPARFAAAIDQWF